MTTSPASSPPPPSRARRVVRSLAWVAIVASFPVWLAAFFVAPFLPVEPATRVVIGGALIAAGELMFWGAGAILGAEVIARFRPAKVTTGRSFSGKRVVVVGAAGGLGEGVVRALAREGAQVVAVARDTQALQALADEVRAEVDVVELTDAASIEAAAARIGAVDHVVCAAGVDVRKGFLAHGVDEIDRQLDVDLRGPLLLARAFLPRLSDGGSMAFLGGFADGRLALPYYAADVAARAGLSAFVESMNRELSLEGRSQRLTFVCPAPADTAAERPYAELWSQLGVTPVSPSVVADFVLRALIERRTRAVMGLSTRLLAQANVLSPRLADLLIVCRFGPLLRARFG
jgi:NAD(P)-dependent dehydrogenase (short-subunit alcohol dehydrogenase family)